MQYFAWMLTATLAAMLAIAASLRYASRRGNTVTVKGRNDHSASPAPFRP
jgi:predicted outer membrane lipoprotein